MALDQRTALVIYPGPMAGSTADRLSSTAGAGRSARDHQGGKVYTSWSPALSPARAAGYSSSCTVGRTLSQYFAHLDSSDIAGHFYYDSTGESLRWCSPYVVYHSAVGGHRRLGSSKALALAGQ